MANSIKAIPNEAAVELAFFQRNKDRLILLLNKSKSTYTQEALMLKLGLSLTTTQKLIAELPEDLKERISAD